MLQTVYFRHIDFRMALRYVSRYSLELLELKTIRVASRRCICTTLISQKEHTKSVDHSITELSVQNENTFLQARRSKPQRQSAIAIKGIKKETAHSALMRACMEEQPNADGFRKAMDMYIKKNKPRQGHMEFIRTAMKFIEPYGLQDDMEVYNSLLNVFPRGIFENRTSFDAVWPKPHPQINLALDILTKMEWRGIIPDQTTHDIMYEVFGRASFPVQKIYRMAFWFEKFKDINPYELPDEVYNDKFTVYKEVLKRIAVSEDDIHVVEVSFYLIQV